MSRLHPTVAALIAAALVWTVVPEARAQADPERDSQEEAGPASDEPRWRFGRSPSVFQEAKGSLATRIGGWVDASFQDNDRRGTHPSVAVNHLNGFLDTRWRKWQLFIEGEYEHEDDRSGYPGERELELEQMYLRYTAHDLLSLRVGRFNTPFGYWVPIHWEILMDTIEKPLHVGRELVPEQQIGGEVGGRWFSDAGGALDPEVRYSAYLGYGTDGLAQDAVDGFAGGADLRALFRERYLVGASVYRQRNDEALDRTETSYMLYTEIALPRRVLVRSEYLRQRRERPAGAVWERDIDVLYAKIRWHFLPIAYLNYRYSYGDDDEGGATSETAIHTVTLGLEPRASVRIKLEVSDHRFRASDREDFAFWGVSFGYLF